MVRKILSSKPISLAEAKEIVEKRLEEEEGIDIQRATLSYLERFSKSDIEATKETFKALKEKFKFSDEMCVMLIDILPETSEEVRTILASEEIVLTPEEIKEILKILEKYLKKK